MKSKNKQRIVFLVGPDRCGKTNIAHALRTHMGIEVFKASSEHHAFLNDQQSFLNDLRYADPRIADFLSQTGVSVIFDRGYPCEFAYSQFFNRTTDIDMLKRLDAEYAALDARIIVCTRRSFKGISDDLNPSLNQEALERLSKTYAEFVAWTKCSAMTLYVDHEDIGREIEEITTFLGYNDVDNLLMAMKNEEWGIPV